MINKLKEILYNNFLTLISLVLILLLNIALLFFPLTNVFGFEFAFVNAILISFLSGINSISYFKKQINKNNFYFLYSGILFLIIPLIITLTNSLFGYCCSLIDGILFYIVITLPSYIIGITIGLISFSISKKISYLIFLILYILILFIPIIEFYFNPQIYFFNPIFGYFPGTIYDEGISISIKLIIYRSLNIIFFLSVFIFLNNTKVKQSKKTKLFLLITLIVSISFLFLSSLFGFSTTKNGLLNHLNKRIETHHFIIHFPSNLNDKDIKKISLYHEYYYSKLTNFFSLRLNNKIDSFVFQNNIEKGSLFGSANADVAKPWLNQIYTTIESYNTSLEHEIAHIFSASFGTTIFKVADGINPAMIEGIAVAASPHYDDISIDYMAALAYKNGYQIKLDKLFFAGNFFTQNSSISYIYSGSFIKYLVKNYGISRFKKFYSNSDFKKIYNIDFNEIEEKYFKYLDSYETVIDSSKAKYYFGKQTLFTKICPRYISSSLKEASNLFYSKNYVQALKIYSDILQKTNNYFALMGYANTSLELKNIYNALNKVESNLKDYENTSYYYNLQLELGDLYSLSDNEIKADSLYNIIILENPNNWLVYLSKLRLYLSNQSNYLNNYLANQPKEKFNQLLKIIDKNNIEILLPSLIKLANITDCNYRFFLSKINSSLPSDNINNSMLLNYLAMFMLDNFDFINAKKIIDQAIVLNKNKYNTALLSYNLEKIEWMRVHFNSF